MNRHMRKITPESQRNIFMDKRKRFYKLGERFVFSLNCYMWRG